MLATIYSPELYAAQQELITASSMKSKQPNLYRAVRNKLKIWKLTDAQIDRIEKTGKVEEYFPIYATVSGTVSEKLVEQGETVKQGQALFKIADLTTVWANFDVYENQLNLNFRSSCRRYLTLTWRSRKHWPRDEFKTSSENALAFLEKLGKVEDDAYRKT